MSVELLHSIARDAADPWYEFVALVAAIFLARLLGAGRPALRFASHVLFFGLLTLLLVANGVAPWAEDTTTEALTQRLFIGVAKATWWIGGAMVLVSSVRLFLTFELKPREGRLLQDLLVGIIYLGTGLSLIAFVFSLPIGTLIATSGVFAIVLGLALQNTLGDLFSGIALNISRPYGVGDWIGLDGAVQGRIVETNWRSTYILSKTNDLLIVPNSDLAKARLLNFSGFDEVHGTTVTVRLMPNQSPAAIEEAMQYALLSANSILKTPAPTVSITSLDASAIEAELLFRVPNITRVSSAKNEIFDLVYRHTRAAGIRLGAPVGASTTEVNPDPASKPSGSASRLLSFVPLFSTLTDSERNTLSTAMQRLTFKKDAVITPPDASMTSLMIVRSGVIVSERDISGQQVELGRLAPGDLFGERGVLMGAAETVTRRALTFVVVYEVSKEHLAGIMRERPALVEELGLLLAKRSEIEHHASNGEIRAHDSRPTSIAARIRHLFHLQNSMRS